MDIVSWDKFESEIAEMVVAHKMPLNAVIAMLARKYDSESCEALVLACVSLCANIDQTIGIGDENTTLVSLGRYQIVASLAADVAALPILDRTCGDLVCHWLRTSDTMFRS